MGNFMIGNAEPNLTKCEICVFCQQEDYKGTKGSIDVRARVESICLSKKFCGTALLRGRRREW